MRPNELQNAVAENIPVVMAAGVVEYHGLHLPIGTDFLIASEIVEGIEERCPCVVAPPVVFGPTLGWAGGIKEGDVDFDPEAMAQYVKEILKHLVAMGFRRIYILQHHQGSEGLQQLCLKRATAEVLRDVVKTWGDSWGRISPDKTPNPSIFSLIKVAGIDSFSTYNDEYPPYIPIGHAGKGETQLIMARYPETVKLSELSVYNGILPEWLLDAHEATEREGKKWLQFCIDGWVRELSTHKV